MGSPDKVSPIQVSEFEKMTEMMEEKIGELKGNNELLEQILHAQQQAVEQQRRAFEDKSRANEEKEAALKEEIRRTKADVPTRIPSRQDPIPPCSGTPGSRTDLIESLIKAESKANEMIAAAKKLRQTMLQQAKGRAEEQLKAFRE